MVTRALGLGSSLSTTENMTQHYGCAHGLSKLAHSWAKAFVSHVKKARHSALCTGANKSKVNCSYIVWSFSKTLVIEGVFLIVMG